MYSEDHEVVIPVILLGMGNPGKAFHGCHITCFGFKL